MEINSPRYGHGIHTNICPLQNIHASFDCEYRESTFKCPEEIFAKRVIGTGHVQIEFD
jgi:hypothetical protein